MSMNLGAQYGLVEVIMVRKNLEGTPDEADFPLPDGYSLRWSDGGIDDISAWVDIQSEAEEHIPIDAGVFRSQYGHDTEDIKRRVLYLYYHDDCVGTAAAWYDNERPGGPWGRVHWVAIRRSHQGKGLARPMMVAILGRLRMLGHDKAYLDTATVRVPAINLYLSLGFEPDFGADGAVGAWASLNGKLKTELTISSGLSEWWARREST